MSTDEAEMFVTCSSNMVTGMARKLNHSV